MASFYPDTAPAAPSGVAGGDLGGTYPNPSVAKVVGATPGTTGLALLGCATPGAVAAALAADVSSPHADILKSTLTADSSGNPSTSGVLHAVYVGRTTQAVAIKHIRCFLTAVMGSTNQIGEFAIFSSPLAPQDAGQVLTPLVVVAAADIGSWAVGTGLKRNTADLTLVVPEGTHLWAGMRTACTGGTGTQPTWRRCFPVGDGQALWLNAAGVITMGTPYTCVVAALGTQPPNMELTVF